MRLDILARSGIACAATFAVLFALYRLGAPLGVAFAIAATREPEP